MLKRTVGVCGLVLTLTTVHLKTSETPTRSAGVEDLIRNPAVKAALDWAKANELQTIEDQIRFCEVPAPPFKEAARAELLRQAFQRVGLKAVRIDAAGNVIGQGPGTSARPRLVISAHLDTVFPAGTDVRVKRDSAVLRGPGIGDDCRGLAVLVAIAGALEQAAVQIPGSIAFVATVGEEGLGDLRGVKHLFGVATGGEAARRTRPVADIDRFLSIDGTGLGIANVGVGSVRYRVTFKGPGGHSFAAFGLPSPVSAMGRAITKIAELEVADKPKTTFNVGRVGGGTAVNAIPAEAWMEVDLRSSDAASLTSLDNRFQRLVDAAVMEENERWNRPRKITVVKERVGVRPAGATPADSPIVRTAESVHWALGLPLVFTESSTDSNIPMSLHIPALTIGGGGRGSDAHTTSESFDTTDAWRGTERALLLTIALAR